MKRKVECLARLFALTQCRVDILQYLKDEKLITDDVMATILNENHNSHATRIATLLNDLQAADKLQLVDYEWTILPLELVRLTLVSRNSKKDWIFNS